MSELNTRFSCCYRVSKHLNCLTRDTRPRNCRGRRPKDGDECHCDRVETGLGVGRKTDCDICDLPYGSRYKRIAENKCSTEIAAIFTVSNLARMPCAVAGILEHPGLRSD